MSDGYRALFLSAQDSILVCDLESGRIIDVNPAATALFGYSHAEFLNLVGRELHPPEAWDSVVAATSAALRDRRDHRTPCARLITKDGRTLYADLAFSHFELHGRPTYYAIIRDITSVVHEERERTLQAEAMSSLGRLAQGVADELHGPTTYVFANLEFLEGALSHQPELLEAVQDCQIGMRAILRGVDQLRVGPVGLEREAAADVDLGRAVAEAARLAHLRAPVSLARSLPPIQAQRSELHKLLRDLFACLDWRSLRVSGDETHQRVTLVGPHPDHLAVDDVFSETGRREPRLAALQHRAVELGWEFMVVTTPEHREVHLILPCRLRDSGRRERLRLLLVDDEPNLLRALARNLRGADVVTASGGPEAWALLRQDRDFDAVVCDMMMPSLGGRELHGRVAEAWPEVASRFLFMTGATLTRRDSEFLRRQAQHLLKPFSAEELLEMLASAQPGLKTNG